MAQYAPELPTTEMLEASYPLSVEAEAEIALHRQGIADVLSGRVPGLVGIVGPCAMNEQVEVIAQEGRAIADTAARTPNLHIAHRLNDWKPRTNPDDWHGLITTEPEQAYATLASEANAGAVLALELAHLKHAQRNAGMLALGWFGGRHVHDGKMMDEVAMHDPTLPLAVKNGLDGKTDQALEHVNRLNEMRGIEAAPVVLLYRGGENAKNPQTWEKHYRDALEATGGRVIVDVAHGSEMAHDPNHAFKKSVDGQIAAMDHVLRLAIDRGEIPAGIMAEASEAASPTDPHMSLRIALNGLLHLNNARYQHYDPWAEFTAQTVRTGNL